VLLRHGGFLLLLQILAVRRLRQAKQVLVVGIELGLEDADHGDGGGEVVAFDQLHHRRAGLRQHFSELAHAFGMGLGEALVEFVQKRGVCSDMAHVELAHDKAAGIVVVELGAQGVVAGIVAVVVFVLVEVAQEELGVPALEVEAIKDKSGGVLERAAHFGHGYIGMGEEVGEQFEQVVVVEDERFAVVHAATKVVDQRFVGGRAAELGFRFLGFAGVVVCLVGQPPAGEGIGHAVVGVGRDDKPEGQLGDLAQGLHIGCEAAVVSGGFALGGYFGVVVVEEEKAVALVGVKQAGADFFFKNIGQVRVGIGQEIMAEQQHGLSFEQVVEDVGPVQGIRMGSNGWHLYGLFRL